MSALGQKQTCAAQEPMSALPLRADIDDQRRSHDPGATHWPTSKSCPTLSARDAPDMFLDPPVKFTRSPDSWVSSCSRAHHKRSFSYRVTPWGSAAEKVKRQIDYEFYRRVVERLVLARNFW